MVVTSAWLAEHAKDANLVILYAGDEQEFKAEHIPGARFLDFIDPHYLAAADAAAETVPAADLEANLSKAGVTSNSRIVVYFTGRSFSQATKVYFALDAMGLGAQTSLLDGGFNTWKSENRPVNGEIAKIAPTQFKACPTAIVATLDFVKARVQNKAVRIIDARDADIFRGDRTPSNKKAGHIPGAANIPYAAFFDNSGKLKTREAIAELFTEAGAKKGDLIIPYCHIGQQASVVYFAARYVGYDVRLFTGSWDEWSEADLPAEVTPKK